MPVIINEFELAPAGPQEEAGGAAGGGAGTAGTEAGAAAAGQKPKAPVQETELILRGLEQRRLRVFAH